MRLTLRTLLAYLDDRLSPANARELGQKITASPFARELAERIRGVVRKRRLANSEPGQKTIDANLIAEYLDDQLTPELVALIEKEILASDQSLAEVAATHQILGLLADPLEIDEALRKRLYQMDPVAEAEAGGAMTEAEISASEEWKPLAPAPTASRRSPMLVLALMVFGWLALLFLDKNLYRNSSDQVLVAGSGQNEKQGVGDEPPGGVRADADRELTADADTGNADIADAATPEFEKPNEKPNAKSASDLAIEKAQELTKPPGSNDVTGAEESGSNTLTASEPNRPSGNMDAGADNTAEPTHSSNLTDAGMVNASDRQANAPNPVIPQVRATRSLSANDPSGMLIVSSLRKSNQVGNPANIPDDAADFGNDEQLEWMWAANLEGKQSWNELLNDRLVCIASPFVATIDSQSSGWNVKVVGSSLFQGISGERAGLKVFSGRLILSRQVASDPQPFLLQVGGQQLLLSPTDTMQRLAINIQPDPSSSALAGDGPASLISDSDAVIVAFAAFGGVCEISEVGSNEVLSIPEGNQLTWNSGTRLSGNIMKQAMLAWEWVAEAEGQRSAGQAELHDTLASQLKSHGAVTDAIVTVAEDANPVIAEWAIQIPIVQRDVEQLVGLLFQSEQHVVRAAAFRALQRIVRTTSGGRQAVISLLETRLDLSEVEQATRMVSEISRVSLEDRLTSEWLVEMLDNDRLVLREMAISILNQHLGRNNNYYADEEKNRRDRAVRRWKSEVDRNGGRLIPPQE